MAPEQARGEEVNARADVFSAGVVLAEMIAPKAVFEAHTAREAIWQGIHHEPPELPDSPWASGLTRKAVARLAEHRYPSAAALARALEEVTLQVEGAEDVHPYPGLASFTEEDAEYFFGRELEVEAMWKKLRRPHLLRAHRAFGGRQELIPSCGTSAGHARGLARHWLYDAGVQRPFHESSPSFGARASSSDTEVMERASSASRRLDVAICRCFIPGGNSIEHVLVIVDQFEELFTLNAPEVQSPVHGASGWRLAVEADVHVLLSMRDDFFCHCHELYVPLHPLAFGA